MDGSVSPAAHLFVLLRNVCMGRRSLLRTKGQNEELSDPVHHLTVDCARIENSLSINRVRKCTFPVQEVIRMQSLLQD